MIARFLSSGVSGLNLAMSATSWENSRNTNRNRTQETVLRMTCLRARPNREGMAKAGPFWASSIGWRAGCHESTSTPRPGAAGHDCFPDTFSLPKRREARSDEDRNGPLMCVGMAGFEPAAPCPRDAESGPRPASALVHPSQTAHARACQGNSEPCGAGRAPFCAPARYH
jgi:hypothetical protein